MSCNFFDEPFDDESLLKLEVYKKYLYEWIPVFVAIDKPRTKNVNVFDFFAGAGTDSLGGYGSPLIALKIITDYCNWIKKNNIKVTLYLNDKDEVCYNRLKENVDNFQYDKSCIEVLITKKDFIEVAREYYSKMKNAANLIFLDQFGVENVTDKVFKAFADLKMTDLLFFISSSHFNRFHEHETFRKILRFEKNELKGSFFKIHRLVVEKYRDYIAGKDYFLAPFSIKKKSTINGLIFGSNHPLGIEKFLKVCWSLDNVNGEANFDIENEDFKPNQLNIFSGDVSKPKKLDLLDKELEEAIIKNEVTTDYDVTVFALSKGCLGTHAKATIDRLVSSKKIEKARFAYSVSTLVKKDRKPVPIVLK